ncbi:MAG: TonB-dependent receptor plug domain-containing protein [Nodosilinea sp.]
MAARVWFVVRLAVVLSVLSSTLNAMGLAARAQETVEGVEREEVEALGDSTPSPLNSSADTSPQTLPSGTPTLLSDLEQPATTIADWMAQVEASLVQITGVRVETTEAGLQLVLETANGRELAAPTTQTVGNALIADIPNAMLALPEGGAFEQFAPAEGIALVSVTNEPGDRVRVAITGTDAPPVGAVTATGLAVTLGAAVVGAEDEAIQVVVTGAQDEGYNPRSATTATRTDTPLRDIPQSIQVVPRQVLEDRNVRTVGEAVETVSGVVETLSYLGSSSPIYTVRSIRGFQQDFSNFRNGFREQGGAQLSLIGTTEQVEVLKGPASVLFGAIEPGGVINLITRQPLDEPYYRLGFEVGNFEQYQPSIDFSGPLTTDDSVLYRLIAAYRGGDEFQDTTRAEITTVAPSLTFKIGNRTN